ncbi:hypothetical protein FKM82_019825 [Ascaphus truei]
MIGRERLYVRADGSHLYQLPLARILGRKCKLELRLLLFFFFFLKLTLRKGVMSFPFYTQEQCFETFVGYPEFLIQHSFLF